MGQVDAVDRNFPGAVGFPQQFKQFREKGVRIVVMPAGLEQP